MTVLYRKYRPHKFSEIIGQDHIVSVLEGAIKNKKLSHAYLFSGTRGTGKTSIARIIAHGLGVKDEDTYEIDAASNRGIDDIRAIREHVNVLPFSSPYKVYIIDEVHMLTKEAFNALLKTLEEPPSHAIFILATTELHKVPDTIVSRCQTFTFKKPSRDVLRSMILKVAKAEGYTLDAGAADLVAMLGDGSFRDTLGMLEKVMTMSSDKKITLDEASVIMGAPKGDIVNRFISSLLECDADLALSALSDIESAGISVSVFATLVLEKMRFILLFQNSPRAEEMIKGRVSDDDWRFVQDMASKKKMTVAIMSQMLEAVERIRRSPIEVLPLEMMVVGACPYI